MSIFQKDCPQCAAPSAVRATRCKCGYFFETAAVAGKRVTTEVVLQEETLYEDYLAARVVQAEATMEVARADAADPENTYRAAQVLLAEQALSAARAELRAQTQRTAQLKKVSRRTEPAAATMPLKTSVMPATRPAAKRMTQAPIVKREMVQLKVASAPVAKPAEPAAQPKHAAKPSAEFRNRQAAKADALVRNARSVPPAPVAPSQPVKMPVAKSSAESLKRPTPVAKSGTPKKIKVAATKDCPHCTATVAAGVERCRCGYSFSSGSLDMPSLSLDAGAVTALDNDATFGGIPRRS